MRTTIAGSLTTLSRVEQFREEAVSSSQASFYIVCLLAVSVTESVCTCYCSFMLQHFISIHPLSLPTSSAVPFYTTNSLADHLATSPASPIPHSLSDRLIT